MDMYTHILYTLQTHTHTCTQIHIYTYTHIHIYTPKIYLENKKERERERKRERMRGQGEEKEILRISYISLQHVCNRNDVIAVDSRCYVGRMKECVSFYAFPDIRKPRAVKSRIYINSL